MNFDDETLQKIRQYNIVEIIKAYVKLQKKGYNHLGLCPFHNEKTPSFNVSEDKGFFHCFGCQESGDAISFLMKIDQLTFSEAVEKIAHAGGIEIQNRQVNYKEDHQNKVKAILTEFKNKAEMNLNKNERILTYLKNRGLNFEFIQKFSLGFVNSLITIENFEARGYSKSDIFEAGIFSQYDQSIKSRFNNRLLFPISNHLGQCIGFSGRVVENNTQFAKYINSSDSKLFNKGHILYGLDKAKHSIKKMNKAILVEGYLDVILSHQSGITHTVGVMGTALTQFQCQLLSRYTNEVVLLFDSDDAGQAAIDKSYLNLTIYGMKTYVATLPEKDPADFLQIYSAKDFNLHLNNAKPFLKYKLEKSISKYNKSDSYKTLNMLELMVKFVNAEKNNIIRKDYICYLSQKLNIDIHMVEQVMGTKEIKSRNTYLKPNIVKTKYDKAAQFLLAEMANSLQKKSYILSEVSVDDFMKIEYITIAKELTSYHEINGNILQYIKDDKTKKNLSRIILEENYKDLFSIDVALKLLLEYKNNLNKKSLVNMLKNKKNIDNSEIEKLFKSIVEKGGSPDGKNE